MFHRIPGVFVAFLCFHYCVALGESKHETIGLPYGPVMILQARNTRQIFVLKAMSASVNYSSKAFLDVSLFSSVDDFKKALLGQDSSGPYLPEKDLSSGSKLIELRSSVSSEFSSFEAFGKTFGWCPSGRFSGWIKINTDEFDGVCLWKEQEILAPFDQFSEASLQDIFQFKQEQRATEKANHQRLFGVPPQQRPETF